MTPEESIEILRQKQLIYCRASDVLFNKALGLGIEALKFRQRWEARRAQTKFPLLPGETEE